VLEVGGVQLCWLCVPVCNKSAILLLLLLQINDRYEFYDELDLDRGDGKYLSPQVSCWQSLKKKSHACAADSMPGAQVVNCP
jgi:hypothetical protein